MGKLGVVVKKLAMRKVAALAATALVPLVLAAVGPATTAHATGTLDQSNTATPTQAATACDTNLVAQTFTAGLSGNLDQVDLDLAISGTPSDLTVQITTTNGGVPTSTVLATAFVPQSAVSSSAAFVSVPLSPPALSVAGTTYAIVLSARGAVCASSSYAWETSGNNYARGTAASSTDPRIVDWTATANEDELFKTYVSPPTPCSTTVNATTAVATVTCPVGNDTWTAPAGVTTANADVEGGHGGASGAASGGAGGKVTATIPVTPSSTYGVLVGGKGGDPSGGDPGAGGIIGGAPGGGSRVASEEGGGGGGYSEVNLGSTRLLVAGGGGGAGAPSATGSGGGPGGGTAGTAGTDGSGTGSGSGGQPGTQTAPAGVGGAGGTCPVDGLSGGDASGPFGGFGGFSQAYQAGGGGGGGFLGGGGGGGAGGNGGGCTSPGGGGGGGGSGHVDASITSYNMTAGTGPAGDGVVTITYLVPTTLSVAKTGPALVTSGSNVSYSVTVTNTGTSVAAVNATVTDVLPSGTSFVSAMPTSGTGWTCGATGNTVTCSNPSFGSSGTATFSIVAHVSATFSGTISNVATAKADNASSATSTPAVVTTACIPASSTTGNVNVAPSGTTCGSGITVGGNVNVPAGGSLILTNSHVGGNVNGKGAQAVTMCGNTITGNVTVDNSTGPVLVGDGGDESPSCAGNTVGGNVTLNANTANTELGSNHIGGYVIFTNNVGSTTSTETSPEVEANTIHLNLNCSGNVSVTNDSHPNTVSGNRNGQCGAPGF